MKTQNSDDDVFKSTLSELVLFLVFMSLILLGQIQAENFFDADGEHSVPLEHYFPLIILSDRDGYKFASNSAIPDQDFLDRLFSSGISSIENQLRRYQGRVNTIEVIGHTDDQTVPSGQISNLDTEITRLLKENGVDEASNTVLNTLVHSDNAGLGLARAAIVSSLIRHGLSPEFEDIEILAYSAGHLIRVNGTLQTGEISRTADLDRRRIEIRFRYH